LTAALAILSARSLPEIVRKENEVFDMWVLCKDVSYCTCAACERKHFNVVDTRALT